MWVVILHSMALLECRGVKATLEFNLPEEQTEHQLALDGWKWKIVVEAVLERLAELDDEGKISQTLDEFRDLLIGKVDDYHLELY